jgi:hypothetical protein
MFLKATCASLALGCLLGPGAMIASAAGKIEAGKPAYAAKPKDAWKDRGRIVGVSPNAPAFTVTILDSAGKEVLTAQAGELKNGKRAYEVEWLQPGTYTMRVTAEGYDALSLEKLEIKANNDLRIDLEFTK